MPSKMSTADFEYTKAKYRSRIQDDTLELTREELESLFTGIDVLRDVSNDVVFALGRRVSLMLEIENRTKHAAAKLMYRIRNLLEDESLQAVDLRLFRKDAEGLYQGLRALTHFRILTQEQPAGMDIDPDDEHKIWKMIDDLGLGEELP